MLGTVETPKSSTPLTSWADQEAKFLEGSHWPRGENTTILEVFGVLGRPERQNPRGFSFSVRSEHENPQGKGFLDPSESQNTQGL